jgi:WD40 repeat protein
MNNISISNYNILASNLIPETTNLVNNNYLPANTTAVNNNANHNLYDRNSSIETNYSCYITNIPNELLDEIFAKLDLKDLCCTSLVCKKFSAVSKYYRNNFYMAQEIFSEYPAISQRKIKLIFNKNNYNKHLKSWLKNFSNTDNTLNYLDNIQNINTFYKTLFFYITKTMQLATSTKAETKFISMHNDIAVSVGYSSDNTNLFIAYLTGLIKIYKLDKNKKLNIQNELNISQHIEYARFSPNYESIIVMDINKKITLIYLTPADNWEIDNNHDFKSVKINSEKFIFFTPNGKYLSVIKRNIIFLWRQSDNLKIWEQHIISYNPSRLTTATFSFNNKYYAAGENNGHVSILSLESVKANLNIMYLVKHDSSITSIKFSINSEYIATTSINNTTIIYKLNSKKYEKIYSIRQDNFFRTNNYANSCFSSDSNTVVINHGSNIIILSNLNSVNNITRTNCELNNTSGKACISNNNNYIAIYTLEDYVIKLYRKNNLNEWHNIINIDTEANRKIVKFSAKEHHFAVISSNKTIVYNLCNCEKITANSSQGNTLAIRSETNILANKDLQSFTIDTPKDTKKYIMFNPYFCQLLVAYNNIIKIFTPSDTYKWDNKLTLNIDMPHIETVKYTNNGSHILVNSTNDEQSEIKLLAVN